MSTPLPKAVRAGILILAAGRSRRFGSDKRLARMPHSGNTLLQATTRSAQASGLPVRVCLRVDDTAIADRLSDKAITTIFCHRAGDGMGATLAEAVSSIADWDAVLVALADMPLVKSTTYRALARACCRDSIAIPCYRGGRGNPVCFGATWFDHLRSCGGDRGARDLISSNPEAVVEVDVDDAGILRDVDHPADLYAMR